MRLLLLIAVISSAEIVAGGVDGKRSEDLPTVSDVDGEPKASKASTPKNDGLGFEYTVFCVRNPATALSKNFCSANYPSLRALNSTSCSANPTGYAPFRNLRKDDWNGCSKSDDLDLKGKVVILNDAADCSLDDRIEVLEAMDAKGLVLITSNGSVPEIHSNKSGTKITLMAISSQSLKAIEGMGSTLEVNAFSPTHGFDPSLLVVFTLAVFCVAVGAYWSGHYRHKLYSRLRGRPEDSASTSGAEKSQNAVKASKAQHKTEEAVSIDLTPLTVFMLVLAMCGMLVLLYYFYSYIIYIILALYGIASSYGLSECLGCLSFFNVVKRFSWRLQCCNITCCKDPETGEIAKFEVRRLVFLLISISVAVVWLVFRHASWAWILQDLLGVAFCINLLRVLRLGSLKIITLFLGLLFFYDIFFVFITPYLTKDGSSVMVQVATGGDSSGIGEGGRVREQLPMVLRVPHLAFNPLSVCGISNASLLGFGDILCPGILVAYCHYFDLRYGTRFRIYYVVEVICYGLGMIATFVSLFLMKEAQPALLYLVPFTVLPAIILSLIRGEFKELWHGEVEAEEDHSCNSSQNGDESSASENEAGAEDDPSFEVRTVDGGAKAADRLPGDAP